jgi:hypothetical protein
LTYQHTDNEGNASIILTRTINVVDTTPPEVTLVGSGIVMLEVHHEYVDDGADWTDNYDGTGHVKATSGSVDTGTVGSYLLEYRYVDTNGNKSNVVTRTVIIQDTTPPEITLNGEEIITIEVNIDPDYVDEGADRDDNYDGTGTVYGSGIVDFKTV